MSDDRVSQPEQTLAAAVGLQTAAINALVAKLHADLAARPHPLWHTAVNAVVAITFAELWMAFR